MATPDPIRLPFSEQIAFFRRKLNLPTERWTDIWKSAHDRAFVVAGAMSADLLDDLRDAVDGAVAGGTTLAEFRRDFLAIIERRGWAGFTGDDRATQGRTGGRALAWRTRTIYHTNILTSRAAGRWQQLNDPELLKERPYWRYVHSDFVSNPRPQHKAWGDSGLTLPAGHPFWKTHFPPNGWGCRCTVKAVRAPNAGDATEPPEAWDTRDAKGRLPGIDKGWDYAPGANARAELRTLADNKLLNLAAPIGAAMWKTLKPALEMERRLSWYDALDAWRAARHTGAPRTFIAGALAPDTLAWLGREKDIHPISAEIGIQDKLVLGKKEARHQKAGDGLTEAQWRQLPALLEAPERILFDTRSGHLLFIGEAADAAGKLTVEFDYLASKKTGKMLNMVVSAYRQRVPDIDGMIKGGIWEVVE